MMTLTITQIGDSLGVVLPKELISQLKVGEGDQLFFSEGPDGWRLTASDPEIAKQLEIGRTFMQEFRDTFHQLAK